MTINQYIKKIRTELNIGQQEFAAKIGLSRSNLSQIERGKSLPTFKTLQKIVNEIHIDANILFNPENNIHADISLVNEPTVEYKKIDKNVDQRIVDLLEIIKSKDFIIELLRKEIEQLKYIDELDKLNEKLDIELKQTKSDKEKIK